ncbi:hypothetical protein Ae201684P_017380 [Aphanomyces euteiches]|uniref:Uncharacterized protein n=1 Tax=Aphanomyces euteiches TaxID=100861 RepID=A0A6G0W4E6_9STRA|nr:hypothetical protein Ae201684_018800 [Aphanomyces euteiches]KAH9051897.1 hypothetical protein Ae201684P_017377 [Aphanomyces euteiches]KAH9051900.1 hypothetical protein Ae201684P_017380 [Aphanomyces euteiches]
MYGRNSILVRRDIDVFRLAAITSFGTRPSRRIQVESKAESCANLFGPSRRPLLSALLCVSMWFRVVELLYRSMAL